MVLIATAVLLFVDINAFKPRLETAASKALGMDVKVDGRMGIRFAPGLFVTLKDVHIRNRGAEVVSAGEARLGIDLLPLLQKDVRIETISLQHPRISFERDRAGRFNFESLKAEGLKAAVKTLPAVQNLSRVSLADGTFLYADQQSGAGFEALDCDLGVRHLRFPGGGTKSAASKNRWWRSRVSSPP